MEIIQQTTALIARDLGLDIKEESMTEEELFNLVINEVAYMIEHRLEYLLSLMYRMDISEQKVSDALSPAAPEPANIGLGRLILERQKQRIYTKIRYKQEKLEDLEEGLEY